MGRQFITEDFDLIFAIFPVFVHICSSFWIPELHSVCSVTVAHSHI